VSETVVELREVFCVHRTNEGDAAALQGLSLDLARGELLAVIGPSGAGKSTLLRVIAGLQPPSAGVVSVLGRDIGRLRAGERARIRHHDIGFLGQHTERALSPDFRISDAVALPLRLRGSDGRSRRARVRELLDAVSLDDRADALPGELSGGERQRVALCAALAHRPALLLADEPTGELDDASAQAIRALIAELSRAQGASVVMVSHDPATAELADRAVRIRDGRVVADRRGEDGALLIGRGGWVQLPAELLLRSGIRERARARVAGQGLILEQAETQPPPEQPPPPRSTAPVRDGRWRPALIEARALERGQGRGHSRRKVIDGLSLAIGPGRMTVVTGRSGVGKTTLLRLLIGLDRPDRGELAIDGTPLGECNPERLAALRRDRIGYLPQEPAPVGFLSAQENVVLALRLRGFDHEAAVERAAVVLARVGLAERAHQPVSRLSAGEAQRVGLARALAAARGLLIVDEPTSRLDEASAATVGELLAATASEEGQTVICATHDPELVRRADQVVSLGRDAVGGPGR
jgi:ABC-type lipoprotein export system ATPase subunit